MSSDRVAFSFCVAEDPFRPYMKVVASGAAKLDDYRDLASITAVAAATRWYRRALIDLLDVDPQLSFTDHLRLGEHVAEVLSHLDRAATVVPAKYKTGTSEKAAQNSGLALKTFISRAAAEECLLEDL